MQYAASERGLLLRQRPRIRQQSRPRMAIEIFERRIVRVHNENLVVGAHLQLVLILAARGDRAGVDREMARVILGP